MTLPILCVPPNDDTSSTLAVTYHHASDTAIAVQSGDAARFGSPTPAAPIRFRLVLASQFSGGVWSISDPTAAATFRATGRSGATLTGVAFESGTNQDYPSGSLVAVAITARDFTDIHARLNAGPINVLQFGTVAGDGVTDDGPAIQAIIDAHPGRNLYAPQAVQGDPNAGGYLHPSYYSSIPLDFRAGVGGGISGDGPDTLFRFAPKVTGIILGAGQSVRSLSLHGQEPWIGAADYASGIIPAGRYPGVTVAMGASDADGIRLTSGSAMVADVNIAYFGRDGINGSAGDLNLAAGLGAEDCQFDRIACGSNRGNGMTIEGGDSNCSLVNTLNNNVNQFWALKFNPFLAGVVTSPQADQNNFDNSQNINSTETVEPVASLVRSGNTVTMTWVYGYTSTVLSPGLGVRIMACSDPTFIGRWRVLTVSGDNKTVTWTQVAADATVAVSSRAVATMVRTAAGVVTLTWAAPLTSPAAHPGDWIEILTCTDHTFLGRWLVGAVASDGTSLTFKQPGDAASVAGGTTAMTGVTLARGISIPPDGTIASAVRSAGVVTLTWAAPYTVNAGSTPFVPAQGISLVNCPDASFNGTYVVKSVASDNASLTYFASTPWPLVSLVRQAGTLFINFLGLYRTTPKNAPLAPGDSVTVAGCSDSSFNGTFTILTFTEGQGYTQLTATQAGSDASVGYQVGDPAIGASTAQLATAGATITSGTARMAAPQDTWDACGLLGGSYYAPSINGRIVWINPYAEGGQRSRFSHCNMILNPTWTDQPDFSAGWQEQPLILSAVGDTPTVNKPLAVASPLDGPVSSYQSVGLTTNYDYTHTIQDAVTGAVRFREVRNGGASGHWGVRCLDPLQTNNSIYLINLDFAGGVTSINSQVGATTVDVNVQVGGSGGLRVGDGQNDGILTTVKGGQVIMAPIPDSAALAGAMYLGSDHGGKLCRKDSGGTVHVITETP